MITEEFVQYLVKASGYTEETDEIFLHYLEEYVSHRPKISSEAIQTIVRSQVAGFEHEMEKYSRLAMAMNVHVTCQKNKANLEIITDLLESVNFNEVFPETLKKLKR